MPAMSGFALRDVCTLNSKQLKSAYRQLTFKDNYTIHTHHRCYKAEKSRIYN